MQYYNLFEIPLPVFWNITVINTLFPLKNEFYALNMQLINLLLEYNLINSLDFLNS